MRNAASYSPSNAISSRRKRISIKPSRSLRTTRRPMSTAPIFGRSPINRSAPLPMPTARSSSRRMPRSPISFAPAAAPARSPLPASAGVVKYGSSRTDGGGLYLSISPNGGRRWVFLYRWHGKPTEIGFGSARDVTLARARELAGRARAKLAEGINPKDARRPSEGATFGECADRVIEAMRPSWRSRKHASQWEMTLRAYAAPLRRLPVDKITTDDVLSVLKPLWNEKSETASRLRGRIER